MKFIIVRRLQFSVIHIFSVCLVRMNKHEYFKLSALKIITGKTLVNWTTSSIEPLPYKLANNFGRHCVGKKSELFFLSTEKV